MESDNTICFMILFTYSDVDFSYAVSNISNSINVSGGKVIIDNLGFAIFKFNS